MVSFPPITNTTKSNCKTQHSAQISTLDLKVQHCITFISILCVTPVFMGTAFRYEYFAGDTLESYHAVFDPRPHVFSFIPTSQKNLYFTKCIFFPPLTIANPLFLSKPTPYLPLYTTWHNVTWPLNNAQQYRAIDLGSGRQEVVPHCYNPQGHL